MRILPERQREAMFALYDFCRAVDDIADERGPATAAERLAALERWRADIAAMLAGHAPAHLAPLDEATRSYHLSQEDFDAVIDGMAMDAEAGHPRAGLGDAGPLLRPGGLRRRPAFGAHFRPASGTRRSAGLPSRPRAPTHQHPARHRRGRSARPALPAARGARGRGRDDRRAAGGGGGPEARRCVLRGGRARSRTFRQGSSHHGRVAESGGRRPRD